MQIKTVAIVVRYFPSVSETFIVNQINGLIDAGVQVRLYAYKKREVPFIHNSLIKHDLLDKVNYFVEPPKNILNRLFVFLKWSLKNIFKIKWQLFFKSLNVFKYGKDAYTLKLFFESQWFLIPYDFELIHAHFGMNGNRIAYVKASGVLPKSMKLITTFHGYDLVPNRIQLYKKEYKHLFKQANAFTVNTPYLESILNPINSNKTPCYILPVGLDTTFFKRKLSKKDSINFDIVFCGRLIKLKGPDLAIDILKKLIELGYSNVRLYLVGDGPLRDQLKTQIKTNNLEHHIVLYGSLSQQKIINLFEQADTFLLPGRYDPETGRAETQGLVIQEAQAMELPVVVSDVGGMKYGVLQNKSGFIIKEGDLDGFVKVLESLILNPKLKVEMGREGRLFVKNNYHIQILTQNLLDIYRVL